ncbi:hypothetical protein [Pseudomonas sp. zfem002]|uniref:hypothetical protein n=1 Tax=Pseudomonas sp. zfem002 TaxID=3078197 RepID=UPI002928329C|nr:hypothetical protein [Pseudomonas sp. zfem002]MDU9391863.1 hypothetical protein [Pseudomonas sp. zfem002]
MSEIVFVALKKPGGATLCSALPHNKSGIPIAARRLGTAHTSMLTFARDGNELWVMCGPLSVGVDLALFKPFAIDFLRPARGPGLFLMEARAIDAQRPHTTLLDFGRYSDAAVEDVIALAQGLQQVLGYVPELQDWGNDC